MVLMNLFAGPQRRCRHSNKLVDAEEKGKDGTT